MDAKVIGLRIHTDGIDVFIFDQGCIHIDICNKAADTIDGSALVSELQRRSRAGGGRFVTQTDGYLLDSEWIQLLCV